MDDAGMVTPPIGSTLSDTAWRALSAPGSIAIVGASDRASSVSFTPRFLETSRNVGYRGEVFYINPKRDQVYGQKCWPRLADLPRRPDVAVINLPDEKVLGAVSEAIEVGVPALMVHAGGFGERGAAGARRQAELQRLCAAAGVAALGPNCLGIVSFANRAAVASIRVPPDVRVGPIAAISQSGSVATILLSICAPHGLSFLASTGNEAVTTSEDLIARALDDPGTRIVVAFVEALRRPREIFALAERARAAGKIIVVHKVGLTDQGGGVSRGHTGALAGSGAVYRQAFDQAGVILVEDFDELARTIDLVAGLKRLPPRARLGVLGTSGGELGGLADLAVELGVALPALSGATTARLQEVLHLPADVLPRNPVDVGTGFANPQPYQERMRACIRAVAADESVDLVAVLQGFYRDNRDLRFSLNREMMAAAAAEHATCGKPVLAMSSRSGQADAELMADVTRAGVPALEGLREALRAVRHLDRLLARSRRGPPRAPALPAAEVLAGLVPWDGGAVPQAQLFAWLARLGLAVTPARRVADAADAARAAAELGPRLVLKIDTPRVVHKSDAGGVALGVTAADAPARYAELCRVLTPPLGAVAGEGVLAATMLSGGVEFYVGAKRDDSFGPVVACGMGGRFLELLGRTALLVAPFDAAEARGAIERSGAVPFLSGFRGGPRADLDALAGLLVRVGDIALALGDRLDVLDLNPVIVTGDRPGGCVADARLMLRPQEHP